MTNYDEDPTEHIRAKQKEIAERYVPKTETRESERWGLLNDAIVAITSDRNNQYGPPSQDFTRTAEFWSTYLREKEGDLDAHDVAVMMILLKVSRLTWSPGKRDSWMDIAGYSGCGWEAFNSDEDDR